MLCLHISQPELHWLHQLPCFVAALKPWPCHSHSLRAVLCSTGNRGTVSRTPHSGLAMPAGKAETDPRERIPIWIFWTDKLRQQNNCNNAILLLSWAIIYFPHWDKWFGHQSPALAIWELDYCFINCAMHSYYCLIALGRERGKKILQFLMEISQKHSLSVLLSSIVKTVNCIPIQNFPLNKEHNFSLYISASTAPLCSTLLLSWTWMLSVPYHLL